MPIRPARITEGATVGGTLQRMRALEVSHFEHVLESPRLANESRDLLRDKTIYTYRAHSMAVWLLRICQLGLAGGRARVDEATLAERLRAALPLLRCAAERIVFEFEVPRPNLERLGREDDRGRFLAGALRFINSVLRRMYGVEVKRLTKRAGAGAAYYLNRSAVGRLFVFSREPEPDDTPGGPRPHIPSNLDEQAPDDIEDPLAPAAQ